MRKFFALVLIPLVLAGCGGGGGGSSIGGGGGGGGGGLMCTAESVTLAQQLPNPVVLFATDNNGVIVELPSVRLRAQPIRAAESLVFGIGTEGNNALGAATQLLADPNTGNITATLNGTAYPDSYLDSGSNANFFTDSSIPNCPSPNQGFYCPAATVPESATLTGTNNTDVHGELQYRERRHALHGEPELHRVQ